MKFCSIECMTICPGTQLEDCIAVAGPDEPVSHRNKNRCAPIDSTHTKLFHVHMQGVSSDGLPYEGEIAVCHGNGENRYPQDCLYAVYFSRNRSKQLVIEFFLSDSYAPHKPLPFAESDDLTVAVIEMLNEDGKIETCIQKAHDEFYNPPYKPKPVCEDHSESTTTTGQRGICTTEEELDGVCLVSPNDNEPQEKKSSDCSTFKTIDTTKSPE